jgi:hypothetical protein
MATARFCSLAFTAHLLSAAKSVKLSSRISTLEGGYTVTKFALENAQS